MAAALSQNGFHTLLKLGQQHSRHKCLYCSAETAAVYTDRSPAAQHCRADCKGNGDGLVFRCGGRVDVLQQAYQFALKGKLSATLHKSTMLPYINTVMPPTERIRSTWQQPFPRTDSIPS